MEALLDRRRNTNTGFALRRSRSVRASLRMIGNKWKNQKQTDMMRLNQSMSDPEESKTTELYTQIIKSDELYSGYHWGSNCRDSEDTLESEMEVKEINYKPSKKGNEKQKDVTLILRSSNDRLNKLDKKEKFTDLFTRSSSTKHKENCKDEDIFRIPTSVPPKAAAILHIPAVQPQTEQSDNRFLVNGFSNDCSSELTGMGPPLGTNQDDHSSDEKEKRSRRGSEGDQGSPRQIFSFHSPSKDRKHGLWMSEQQLSMFSI